VNIGDTYTSGEWLKAADLNGQDYALTIRTVIGEHQFDDGQKQIVIDFHETEKKLGLNWTNANTIAEDLQCGGDDIEQHWPGKKIRVYPTRTQMGKKTVSCIRIRHDWGGNLAPTAPVATQPVAPPVTTQPPTPPFRQDPLTGALNAQPAIGSQKHAPIAEDDIPF